MSSDNLDAKFEQIVHELAMDDELEVWEVNRAIVGMNESATYLGRYILRHFMDDKEAEILDKEARTLIRNIIHMTDTLSSMLADCDCPDCSTCDECDGDEFCPYCDGEEDS